MLEEKDAGNSSIRRVAVEPMRNELNRLSSSLPNTANKTDHSAAENNSDAKDSNPNSELSTLLKPLVNLPEGSKIVDIDHMPITSTKDALAHIDEALSRGSVVKLSIEGVPGQDGVYIMPQLKR